MFIFNALSINGANEISDTKVISLHGIICQRSLSSVSLYDEIHTIAMYTP